MLRSFLKWLAGLAILFSLSCSDQPKENKQDSETNYYTQANSNRVAAEWEPAVGTMIVWPLSVPYKLVIELAKDNHLYTLVENEVSKEEAQKWYTKWGIDPTKNTFVKTPQGEDSWWVRDWGPSAVFTPEGNMKLGDGRYIYSTPVTDIQCGDSLSFLYMTLDKKIIKTETDDSATFYFGNGMKIDVLDLPFINTGGNVLTDGLGTAFSTCILLNENQFFNVPKEKFLNLNKELLGLSRYHILSNFEKRGIQHIDCYLKLLDEERILVIEPPRDHAWFQVYEDILQNELKKLVTPYGRPYEILRIKSARYNKEKLAAYANSIIINKTVYVPLFNISEDSSALSRWQEIMPGYAIKGFDFELSKEPLMSQKMKAHYKNYGWDAGDALHCRTRAVWDSEMLFISTKRIAPLVSPADKNIVYATIIDYSEKGLEEEKTELRWRLAGDKNWNAIALNQGQDKTHFSAEIPRHKTGATIEYYISAVSKSGRQETQPRTAPLGFYNFTIK
jgi:agmatine/peptidylarginine deiminase